MHHRKLSYQLLVTTDQDLPKDFIAQRSDVYLMQTGHLHFRVLDIDRQRQVDHLDVVARFQPSVDGGKAASNSSSPVRKLVQSFYDDSNLVRKKPRHESKGTSTSKGGAHFHHKFVVIKSGRNILVQIT